MGYQIDDHGWMEGEGLQRCFSPNFDMRPDPEDISLVVIHGISLPPGHYGSEHIQQLFTNSLNPQEHPYFEKIKDLRVSTHLLIRRDGALSQFVSLRHRAWHAGASSYEGRSVCNDFSIGIEMEGSDDEPYQQAQYQTLQPVLYALISHFPRLSPGRITGHEHIAPGRKTDPGPYFDWEKLRSWFA